jgi:hypothetical protein
VVSTGVITASEGLEQPAKSAQQMSAEKARRIHAHFMRIAFICVYFLFVLKMYANDQANFYRMFPLHHPFRAVPVHKIADKNS